MLRRLLPFALAVLAACDHQLDLGRVKTSIRDELSRQTGATVRAIVCPDAVEVRAAEAFVCTAEIDSGSVPVLVTQIDVRGNVKWELRESVLQIAELEKQIAIGVRQQQRLDAQIDCGPRFRPAHPGDTFVCSAKASGRELKVTARVADTKGTVNWELRTPADASPAP